MASLDGTASPNSSAPSNSSVAPDDTPELGELFHAAFRGLRRTWAEQLAPWELTPHQWRALMTLHRHSHGHGLSASAGAGHGPSLGVGAGPRDCGPGCTTGDIRLKDLAERLRIAPRSATEVVDQLEAKGLVRREPDPSDRRATLIVPTEAGRQLFTEVQAERRDKSNEFFSRLNAEDRSELARILAQLRD